MCGIVAAVTLVGRREAQASGDGDTQASDGTSTNGHDPREKLDLQLIKSLKAIHHRGPDSSGRWVSHNGHVGLLPLGMNLVFARHFPEREHRLTLHRPW